MLEIQLPLHQNPQKGMNGKFLPKNTLEIRGGGVGSTNLTSTELEKSNSAKKTLKLIEKSSTNLNNIQVYPIKLNTNSDPLSTIVSVNFIDVKSSTARNSSDIKSTQNNQIFDNNLTSDSESKLLMSHAASNNNNLIKNNPLWNDESNSGWKSTGEMSDRSSVYSIDDGDFDREASRKVGNQLKVIESVLYEQIPTDSLYLNECKEWLEKFPHLRILGNQILKCTKDDALDQSKSSTHRNTNQLNLNRTMSPVLNTKDASNKNQLKRRENSDINNQGIILYGSNMKIHRVDEEELNQNREELGFIEEEIFHEDGIYEELLAYDNQEEEYLFEHNKRLNINKRRKHGLPPITPKASMKDLVTSSLFDHMWSELIDWSMDLIKNYAKYTLEKEIYYESNNGAPQSENPITTPNPQHSKFDVVIPNETDKLNLNTTFNLNQFKPSIVQLKLFDPPVNNSALLSLNNDKLSDKQSYTLALSRDNSTLYNQNGKALNNNYEGLLESKFGYSESVSTVAELAPSSSNLKELLRIKQLNKNGFNSNKNLAPIMNYNRIGSGSRRQLQNNYKKRFSSIEISSNSLLDNKNIIIHGAGLGKPSNEEKNVQNSLIINQLNPINLNPFTTNRSNNNSTQTYHIQNNEDPNSSFDNDYLDYNFHNFSEQTENSVDEINIIQPNNNNNNFNRNYYYNSHYNHLRKNNEIQSQLPPIGSSMILKPLRISSANNLKINKERSDRPLTSTASRHDNIYLNKRSTTPSSISRGMNNFYSNNMKFLGAKFNSGDTFYSGNPIDSLSNYLSTKSFAIINNNNNNTQQASNRKNSIKDNLQGFQKVNK
ncbi:unnamed protein product [Brachionus calyciflorus]|uniref:DUF3719 domain-containing protein n=1 Tax=Brachionus calyciflorus TaxID=104777 RepID=A0A814G842_9BILA|nr:unnamed protein product [Brachionus calyciflorus]